MGLEGGLTQPLVIVGFNRLVILITYDMKYFTMDAVSLASILAQNRPSSHMWTIHKVRTLSWGREGFGKSVHSK